MTVYPPSTEEAVRLAKQLCSATHGLAGPKIPFDMQYRPGSLVYYRYGSFRGTKRKPAGYIRGGPDGQLQPDERGPKKAIPAWVEDPFPKWRKRRSLGPIGREYLVFTARTQRGKGGVYDAIDLSVEPPRAVVIKEGRRHGETDRDGKDGFTRLVREARVLRSLRKEGVPVPEVFREFSQNGNRYAVLESFDGRPLFNKKQRRPSRSSWRRAAKILDDIGPLLAAIHAVGWVWRDCKPSHILVLRDAVNLIDFEVACRIDERRISPWGSADYLPPGHREKLCRRPGTLEDDYALGVITFQFMCGEFPPRSSRRRSAFYRRAGCPDSLRARIEDLLRH